VETGFGDDPSFRYGLHEGWNVSPLSDARTNFSFRSLRCGELACFVPHVSLKKFVDVFVLFKEFGFLHDPFRSPPEFDQAPQDSAPIFSSAKASSMEKETFRPGFYLWPL